MLHGYHTATVKFLIEQLIQLAVSRMQDFSVDHNICITFDTGKHFPSSPLSCCKTGAIKNAGLSPCSIQSLNVILYLSFPGVVRQLLGSAKRASTNHKYLCNVSSVPEEIL